ncbi:hypothetical protein ACA910_006393 [Epithemia clementina (nom. ined.)]
MVVAVAAAHRFRVRHISTQQALLYAALVSILFLFTWQQQQQEMIITEKILRADLKRPMMMVTTVRTSNSSSLAHQQKAEDGDYDNFALASNQSFGFFTDISNVEWQRIQNKVRNILPNTCSNRKNCKYPKSRGHFYQSNYEPELS